MKSEIVNGKVLSRKGSTDAAAIGTGMVDVSPRLIEVTTSGTYRIYESPTKYRSKYMYKGVEYDGEGVRCITASDGTALTAGVAYYVY